MRLSPPFIISPALAPGLRIGNVATLSLLDTEVTHENRDRVRFELHTDAFTYVDDQLRSGVGGFRSPVEAFESFLGFLEAAAESYNYEQFTRGARKGENTDLFPPHIVEWAADHSQEICDARCSICDEDGNPKLDLIEEN